MEVVTKLKYEGSEKYPFGMDKVRKLCSVLPLCGSLEYFELLDCEVGDEGMAVLTESLQHCRNLKDIILRSCRLRHAGAQQLACLIHSLPMLRTVRAHFNYFNEEDIAMLFQECRHGGVFFSR